MDLLIDNIFNRFTRINVKYFPNERICLLLEPESFSLMKFYTEETLGINRRIIDLLDVIYLLYLYDRIAIIMFWR